MKRLQIILRWVIDLNVKTKSVKLLEKNGEKFGIDFLVNTTTNYKRKKSINWTLLKLKVSAYQKTWLRK